MTDTTATSEQSRPTFAEKAKDTLTDARYAASYSKEKFEEIAETIRRLNERFPKLDEALERIADFTRRNPLTALEWHSLADYGSIGHGKPESVALEAVFNGSQSRIAGPSR